MRRIFFSFCILVTSAVMSIAQTGTPKTVSDLTTELNATLPDNTNGAITPLVMRQMLIDIIASYGNLSSSSVFTAAPSVPTAPFGTNTTQAASTAFVQANGGGSVINNLPPFTTPCNPTGITAPAIACPAITAIGPLGISGSFINANSDSPNNNIFMGAGGNGTVTGSNNIGIGKNVQIAITSGSRNLAIGITAETSLTSGVDNIGFGSNALTSATTATSSIGVGTNSLASSVTGDSNVGVGNSALNHATGNFSTAVGALAGFDLTTGNANTFYGINAGRGITTGANNVALGNCSGLPAATAAAVIICTGDGVTRIDWNLTTAATWTLLRTNFSERFYTTYGTPTIASGACGTGANGVITSGHNQSGLVTIGAAATTTCTVNFSTTFSTIPDSCVVFPANAAAAATGTTVAYVSSISTSQWVITGSALANTAYRYICI